MAERMLKFVKINQAGPEKRPAKQRRGDFHEVYSEFIAERAEQDFRDLAAYLLGLRS